MPQASERVRDEIKKRFGSLDPSSPELFLIKRGWVRHADLTWSRFGATVENTPADEFACIAFLMIEWGYGRIREHK